MIILAHCGHKGFPNCFDCEDIFIFNDNIQNYAIDFELWDWACDNITSHLCGEYHSMLDYEWEDYLEKSVFYDYKEITYDEYLKWCEHNGYMKNMED